MVAPIQLSHYLSMISTNDHNKPHSLMSDPTSTMYFHNMSCDLSNKILFKPKPPVSGQSYVDPVSGQPYNLVDLIFLGKSTVG